MFLYSFKIEWYYQLLILNNYYLFLTKQINYAFIRC